ncbi:DUF6082 family protein [Streptomyces sp. NPDC088745]|uniref:DUF6082 family protein n=1 Tax=Streptomyces sp. NPDC088745 TaxID=3365884 RepID=UPI00381B1D17
MKHTPSLIVCTALGAAAGHLLLSRRQHKELLLERTQRMHFDQRLALLAGTPEMRERANTTTVQLPDDAARTAFLIHGNMMSAWFVEYETRLMSSAKLRGCLRYLFQEEDGIKYWDLAREGWNDLDLQKRPRGARFLEIVDEEHEVFALGRNR